MATLIAQTTGVAMTNPHTAEMTGIIEVTTNVMVDVTIAKMIEETTERTMTAATTEAMTSGITMIKGTDVIDVTTDLMTRNIITTKMIDVMIAEMIEAPTEKTMTAMITEAMTATHINEKTIAKREAIMIPTTARIEESSEAAMNQKTRSPTRK